MHHLDKTAWEVLNATADDWENLEQIYHAVCLDFSTEHFEREASGAYYLRPVKGAPLLEEVADRIRQLAESGLFEVRLENRDAPPKDLKDQSYVWRGWFRMTPEGRNLCDSSPYANLVEQEQPQ